MTNVKDIKIMGILSKIAVDLYPVANARLAAALVYKNEIISLGVNQKKSHPFQVKFCRHEEAIFLHSETDAIKNALKRYSLETVSRSSLYICRVKREPDNNKNMIWGLAKPCSGCQRAISAFNISTVYYTDDDSRISCL